MDRVAAWATSEPKREPRDSRVGIGADEKERLLERRHAGDWESDALFGLAPSRRRGMTSSPLIATPAPRDVTRGVARRSRRPCRLQGKRLKRLARPERFELPTPRSVVWCSIQLSYGRSARRSLPPRTQEASGIAGRRQDGPGNRRYDETCLWLEQPLRSICQGFQDDKAMISLSRRNRRACFEWLGTLRQR